MPSSTSSTMIRRKTCDVSRARGAETHLAEVQTSDHLLERLLARLVRRLVDLDVVLSPRQDLVLLRVEGAPLAVDRDLGVVRQVEVLDLRDVRHLLHVGAAASAFALAQRDGRIAARAEDDADLRARVDVARRDERAGRVVDERVELDRNVELLQTVAQHLGRIVALDIGRAEALRPSQQDAVVDALLVARV